MPLNPDVPSRERNPRQAKQEQVSRARARLRANSDELAGLWKLAAQGREGLLKARSERLADLLRSDDDNVRLQTERLLLEQQFGKPRQAVEMKSESTVRTLVEAPPEESRDAWLERCAESRAAADAVTEGDDKGQPN